MLVGRLLIVIGLTIAAVGLIVVALSKLGLPFGSLPGDLIWRGEKGTVYFPVVTCLVISVLGSLALWLFNRR